VATATSFVSALVSSTPKGEVAALLQKHGDAIKQMGEKLAKHPGFKPSQHDKLWQLRFLLSAKADVKKAVENAESCIVWRAENKMDEIAASLKSTPWEKWPASNQVQTFTPCHIVHPDPSTGIIVFQRMSENDFDGLLGTEKAPKISDEEWIQYQLYWKEWMFQRRDAVSRRTGSLAKSIILLDVGGLSQKHIGSKRYKKLMTHPAIKRADDMYPQALGTIVVVNLPGALAFIFNSMIKPLAPPKVQDKIKVVSGEKKTREAYAALGLQLKDVPDVLGGEKQGWPPAPDARKTPP